MKPVYAIGFCRCDFWDSVQARHFDLGGVKVALYGGVWVLILVGDFVPAGP